MILVDTSVLIDYLRSDTKVQHLFRTLPIAVCGISRAEVLHGARSPQNRQDLVNVLDSLHQVHIPDRLWDFVGDSQRP